MENVSLSDPQQPLSVSQLNRLARTVLERDIGTIWLAGEISNFTKASSGHWYFTLKDSNAQVKAAMFRNTNRFVRSAPREGDHVIVRASVGLYEPRGDYQLVAEKMVLEGEGQLKQAFEQLKVKLHEEGLFAATRKRPLPSSVRRIGVITSSTGAALFDVLTVLGRRNPSIEVVVYPSMVQGEQASGQLINALHTANQRREVDVVLLTRGGGSLEDLWCFNDERLARAIASSALPVVSAVGHEVDITIADFVADVRAPTPSAAAELLSDDKQAVEQTLGVLGQRLLRAFNMQHKRAEHRWRLLAQRLEKAHPASRLQTLQQTVDQSQLRMQRAMSNYIKQAQRQLAHLSQLLHSVSPLATLARGYSITFHNEHTLTDADALTIGDTLTTKLHNGSVESQVTALHRQHKT